MKKTFSICVLLIAATALLSYLVSKSLFNKKISGIEDGLSDLIVKQESNLETIANVIAKNKSDSVTESVIRDCTLDNRGRFDDLLGRLNDDLSRGQLLELDRLFGRCGYVFADRKIVMSFRLKREVEVYESYINELAMVTDKSDLKTKFKLKEWKELAKKEEKQSELYADLVNQQEQIITALLSGKKHDSPEIKDILLQVKETKENLILLGKQAKDLRGKLIPSPKQT